MNHPTTNVLAIGLALAAAAFCGGGVAGTLEKGGKFEPFAAKDQHGVAFQFEPGIRFVLVSFDMATGKKANKALAELGQDYLPGQKAVFVANIHGMPAIGRFFAMPKMRKYPHRIVLGDREGLFDSYPKQEDRVTVLSLEPDFTVADVLYWDPEKDDLRSWLK